MDAFYASVEQRDNPQLRGKPVIVAGGHRGVVAAASYEARQYGVRSAMPTSYAVRLCPHAVVLPPDRQPYVDASAEVMAILRETRAQVEPLSLDEAFLDVTQARQLGRPAQIGSLVRRQIAEALNLSCSVGIGPSKLIAKLASARCKPDGLLVVPQSAVLDFLHPLPVTVLWGIGARTAGLVHRLGVRTVGDLAEIPTDTLRRAVGAAVAEQLHELSWGRDPRPVTPPEPEKSISADHTCDVDLVAGTDVLREMRMLAEDVSHRMRQRGLVARTVAIKIRFADFHTVSRARTLPSWTDSTESIFQAASQLYRSLRLDQPRIRLVGVRCERLRDRSQAFQQLAIEDV
jgi:DNA polymerase-4